MITTLTEEEELFANYSKFKQLSCQNYLDERQYLQVLNSLLKRNCLDKMCQLINRHQIPINTALTYEYYDLIFFRIRMLEYIHIAEDTKYICGEIRKALSNLIHDKKPITSLLNFIDKVFDELKFAKHEPSFLSYAIDKEHYELIDWALDRGFKILVTYGTEKLAAMPEISSHILQWYMNKHGWSDNNEL